MKNNILLNIMSVIIALCMIVMTYFVITTSVSMKEDSKRSLSRIEDIEEKVSSISDGLTAPADGETAQESSTENYSDYSASDINDLADATTALSEAVEQLQQQSSNMATVDYNALSEAIERLNETSISLEETAGRIAAIFG